MTKIYLALYKGNKTGNNPTALLARLADWAVRKFTKGIYSHCEIAVERVEYTDKYTREVYYDCYSASACEGCVRQKEIDVTDGKWDLIPLQNVTEAQIKAYFEQTQGKRYDWFGALGIVLGMPHARSKYFCSEWCLNAIRGNSDGWRFSPNDLSAIFDALNNWRRQRVRLRNGNPADIIYQSTFGKLLVVEYNGDELSPVHWHNADGSFYADAESDLDIIHW